MPDMDTRAFDGPWDKQITRKAYMEIVNGILKGRDFAIRVPGFAPPDDTAANRGRLLEVENLPGDTGRRFTHEFLPNTPAPPTTPITFDAGSCALWVTPGGWRCLLAYQHDDPTHGINVAIYDLYGAYRTGAIGVDGYEALDVVREGMP